MNYYQVDPPTVGTNTTNASWFVDGPPVNTQGMKLDPKLWEDKMSNGYGSRKFLITLGVMLSALAMVLLGDLAPADGIKAVLAAALGYLTAEGAGDVAERFKK